MTSNAGEQDLFPNVQPFPGPAVYMFQPTHYAVVENDQLAEWENALAQKVGLSRPDTGTGAPGIPAPRLWRNQTWSCCGSGFISEACDCDEI